MSKTIVSIMNVEKVYGENHVVKNMNMNIAEGEFLTLLGPSGCGKTTTLRMISGFEMPTTGVIKVQGESVEKKEPYQRDVNTVFQNYALFPNMNVYENVAYGLKVKKVPKTEIHERVTNALKMVQLEGFGKRRVTQMSGGQKQRVAIARAIINRPKVLLLDEPLGALDLKLRKQMQIELKRLQKKLGITFIYVTHDQEEALTMSDKIVVMSEGKIQQIGTPEDIYNEPINAFVADFIGESNIFNGIMTGKLTARFCGGTFTCVDDVEEGTHVTAVVRPEDVLLTAPGQGIIDGTVSSVIFKGIHYEITVESGKNEIVIQSVNSAKVGQRVGMKVEPDNIHIMIAEDNTNIFRVDVDKEYMLEYNGNKLGISLKDIIKGSRIDEDGTLLDGKGLEIDLHKVVVTAAIKPQAIRMTDEQEEGLVQGYISNLIYKGDHYSYVVRADIGQDFVVDDEYLWNMEDQVGLVMPAEKMEFTVKR